MRRELVMVCFVTAVMASATVRAQYVPPPTTSAASPPVSTRLPPAPFLGSVPQGTATAEPITLTVQWGPTTPKFINALISNENLTSVLIGLLRNGSQVATIKLQNASVSDYIETDQGVQLSFTYQKITWTWVDGGITATDDWEAPIT